MSSEPRRSSLRIVPGARVRPAHYVPPWMEAQHRWQRRRRYIRVALVTLFCGLWVLTIAALAVVARVHMPS